MSDYTPLSVIEKDVRNFTTPPLDFDDVSTAEILLKIESTEIYVRRVYFEGGSIPEDGRIATLLLIISNILARSDLARKYGSLSMERLGDYTYEIAGASVRGKTTANPIETIKSWQRMGLEILHSLSADRKYQVRMAND